MVLLEHADPELKMVLNNLTKVIMVIGNSRMVIGTNTSSQKLQFADPDCMYEVNVDDYSKNDLFLSISFYASYAHFHCHMK